MNHMVKIHKELDNWLGKNSEKLENQILSKRVFISPH